MPRIATQLRPTAALAAFALAACEAPPGEFAEQELGPIEQVVTGSMRDLWPGVDTADGERVIPRFNGFSAGEPVSYWFGGLAPRATADMYWFCREGDSGCPFDERGVLDRARTVGGPVFARMPGEQSYSPYWWVRVVRVPDDYEPDTIKSVQGIEQALADGRATMPWFHHEFGGWIGPEKAIEHTLLVLDGTRLEGNGAPLPDGRSTLAVPVDRGWHQRYQVSFYDFTTIEGVLPAAKSSPEWTPPEVPAADVFVVFRDCAARPEAAVCAAGGKMAGAVSERALGVDLTGDGDRADTNTLFAASPRAEPDYPDVAPYSPLWAVQAVTVVAERDAEVALIDSSGDQATSDVRDVEAIADLVAAGLLHAPEPLAESRIDVPIAVNEGVVFYDCPAQIAAR